MSQVLWIIMICSPTLGISSQKYGKRRFRPFFGQKCSCISNIFDRKATFGRFSAFYFSDLVRMSYYHLKSTFYLRDVTFRILTGGLVINMVALLRLFFAKKGWEREVNGVNIFSSLGPLDHLISFSPTHTHMTYTQDWFYNCKESSCTPY